MQLHTAVRRQAANMKMLVWLFFLVEAYMAVRALSIELYFLKGDLVQLAHTVVLTGYRLLPRQDLVRNRLFFLLGNYHTGMPLQ